MNIQFKQLSAYIFFSFFLCLSFSATAVEFLPQIEETQLVNSQESIFDRLSHGKVLEVTLKTDLGSIINDRKQEKYQPAVFTFEDVKGHKQKWNVKVKPRGKYRRRVCDFPPVRIKFAKKELVARGMSSFNKYKLVTHCMDNKMQSKELIMKEFLAYQLYNELTENSFRTQLVKITYLDSKGDYRKIKRWGILLENTDELVERIGGEECKCLGLSPEEYHAGLEKIHSVFQYMIGNEDWDLLSNRNVKLIRLEKSGKITPIPYDFDFSGLVNAPYAIPNSNHNLTNITDRVFLGNTCDPKELFSICSYFRSKKKTLIDTVKGFKLLTKLARAEALQYLESFFEIIKDPETAGAMFFHNKI